VLSETGVRGHDGGRDGQSGGFTLKSLAMMSLVAIGFAAISLAPLLDAAPAIPLHAFAAMAAFGLGVVQLAVPKGTLPHLAIGAIWVGLMAIVAISSFWIHQFRRVGPWSPIHLLSIFTLIMLPLAVWKAHTHQLAVHRRVMIYLFSGAGRCRAVYAAAGADHARGPVRPLIGPVFAASRRVLSRSAEAASTRAPRIFKNAL
jgi:uncharacterized membrane protein